MIKGNLVFERRSVTVRQIVSMFYFPLPLFNGGRIWRSA